VGGSYLQTAAVERGTELGRMTLRELYRQIINTSVRSALVTGIEPILMEEPVLKLRAHLGALAFIEVFFNEETGKTSFALIKNSQRIFGADNTRAWHLHPFDNPESHGPCEEMSFESFLVQVEENQEKWKQPTTGEGTAK
jgi:hypothetical protein